MRELGFAVLAIIAAVMPSSAYDTSLVKTYWIGGDEGPMFEAANWSEGFSEGNWKNTHIAVFTNSATVNVDSKHSFFSHVLVESGDVNVTAADPTFRLGLTGDNSSGARVAEIVVAEGANFEVNATIFGMRPYNGYHQTLAKNGDGTLTVKSAIDYFRTIDVVEGVLKFSTSRDITGRVLENNGTHANIENLMKIRDGAKVELYNSNPFYNRLIINIEEGGLLNSRGFADVIGAISGGGTVSNGVLHLKLWKGPHAFSGRVINSTITLSGTNSTDSAQTEEEYGFILGAADAFSSPDSRLKVPQNLLSPANPTNSCIRFAEGIGTFTVNDLTGCINHPIWLADTAGNVVTMRVHNATTLAVRGPVSSDARGCLMFDRSRTFDSVLGPGADLAAVDGVTVTLGESAVIDPGAVFRFEKGTTLDLGGRTVTVRRFLGSGRKTNGTLIETEPPGLKLIIR
jgi:hypothetical protein